MPDNPSSSNNGGDVFDIIAALLRRTQTLPEEMDNLKKIVGADMQSLRDFDVASAERADALERRVRDLEEIVDQAPFVVPTPSPVEGEWDVSFDRYRDDDEWIGDTPLSCVATPIRSPEGLERDEEHWLVPWAWDIDNQNQLLEVVQIDANEGETEKYDAEYQNYADFAERTRMFLQVVVGDPPVDADDQRLTSADHPDHRSDRAKLWLWTNPRPSEPTPEPTPEPSPPTVEPGMEVLPPNASISQAIRSGAPKIYLQPGAFYSEPINAYLQNGRSLSILSAGGSQDEKPKIRPGDNHGVFVSGKGGTVEIQGLDITASRTEAVSKNHCVGVHVLGQFNSVLVAGCDIRWFTFGMTLQGLKQTWIKNLFVYDNTVAESYQHYDHKIGGGHSSGLYADYVEQWSISNNIFLNNGWRTGVSGASRTKFNHNVYVNDNTYAGTLSGNYLQGGSSFDAQIRSTKSIDIIDNVSYRSAMGLGVFNGRTRFTGNLIAESVDDDGPKGAAIGVGIVPGAEVHRCVALKRVGGADWIAAINAGEGFIDNQKRYTGNGVIRVTDSASYLWNTKAGERVKSYDSRMTFEGEPAEVEASVAEEVLHELSDLSRNLRPLRDYQQFLKNAKNRILG